MLLLNLRFNYVPNVSLPIRSYSRSSFKMGTLHPTQGRVFCCLVGLIVLVWDNA